MTVAGAAKVGALGPLRFVPVYKQVVWGGRRLAAHRSDLPAGPIGESWDLADHADGMSVVAGGPLAGTSLAQLLSDARAELLGPAFAATSGPFPLMVKLIDAADVLSVQVHPDDELAQQLGVGRNGKTECWRVLADGGPIYQGTKPGIDRAAFEAALAAGRVAETLNRYDSRAGDFFFLPARTVHALGAGCLVYEVQQTSNVTFRVDDWGRMGLDGKPRPLHVNESLATIDFSRGDFGPRRPPFAPDPRGGETRQLADCRYFQLEERRGRELSGEGGACAIVTCLAGSGVVATRAGDAGIAAMQTVVVPAAAGPWRVRDEVTVLVATPRA